MHFVIEKHVSAEPETVWPWIAEPARMSEWSEAPIRLRAVGDQGNPGTTGAVRVVLLRLPGLRKPRTAKLIEVVERGEAPWRLHYRLINGYPIEGHRGEVELSRSERGGTDLRWEVRATVAVGLDRFLTRQVHKSLDRSLDSLGACVREGVPLPTLAAVEEASEQLWSDARELLEMQRHRASSLAGAGDPLGWFARIYSIVTEKLLDQAHSGAIVHPAWLLRLIPIFERYYASNLSAFRDERLGALEAHWARAFRIACRGREPDSIGPGLFHGIRAHVEGDLGRSLAEVYAQHYSPTVDYARFRADYIAMNSIFRGASDAMLREVPAAAMPRWFRLARRTLPAGLLDRVRDRTFYDMPERRQAAFDDGARIAKLLISR